MAKINSLSYQEICDKLGSNHFSMHYDCSDALRSIDSEEDFESARSILVKLYGDVEVEINPSAYWFDKVKILDENWQKAQDEYISSKAEWCSKYGCE